MTYLSKISHLWREIGIALEVAHSKLNNVLHTIYISFVANLEGLDRKPCTNISKLSIVIGYWIDQSADDRTWNELIKAIEGPLVGSRSTAKDIRKYLKSLRHCTNEK